MHLFLQLSMSTSSSLRQGIVPLCDALPKMQLNALCNTGCDAEGARQLFLYVDQIAEDTDSSCSWLNNTLLQC